MSKIALFAFAAAILFSVGRTGYAAEGSILVQSTTSTANTGLYDYLLPIFEKKTGIKVNVVAVGTGQAIKNAMNGDGDVLFVHSKPDEEKFVADGYGMKRSDVMYNDFVVVGPSADPAKIDGTHDAVAAFKRIAERKLPFASRADDSGTDIAEKAIWKVVGIDPKRSSGAWYRETGTGMGATLNTAAGMEAYALTDRGTWITFKNRGPLKLLVEGGPELLNQYGIMLVNPAKYPHVKAADGQAFIDWVLSAEGQKVIADYKVGGEQIFFPNAKK
jgi:tungstate transport system substrate-binding protein